MVWEFCPFKHNKHKKNTKKHKKTQKNTKKHKKTQKNTKKHKRKIQKLNFFYISIKMRLFYEPRLKIAKIKRFQRKGPLNLTSNPSFPLQNWRGILLREN
jgi:hypothetical protein